MSERLAIVGASVRAAAASAVRAGFEVVAADRFADDDLARIASATQIDDYPRGLPAWLRRCSPPPDAWIYTGALENEPRLVDAMAAVRPLLGNRGEVLRAVRSVSNLADALRSAGYRFPETRESPAGLPRDGTWLAKTGRGGGGSGVRRLEDSPAQHAFFQRCVPGIPCAAVFLAANADAVLLGIVRQLVGEPWLRAHEFQYCGAIGPWPVSAAVWDQIEGIGRTLAERFRLVGLFGLDVVLDQDVAWTIEVNPRYPASAEVLDRVRGSSAVAAHVAACRWRQLPPLVSLKADWNGRCHGKAILFARRPVVISKSNTVSCHAESSSSGNWPAFADLPRVGTTIDAAHPVMTLFADGATVDEVDESLRSRVAKLEAELYAH